MKTITFTLTDGKVEILKKFMHAKYLCGDLHPADNPLDDLGLVVIHALAQQEASLKEAEKGEAAP